MTFSTISFKHKGETKRLKLDPEDAELVRYLLGVGGHVVVTVNENKGMTPSILVPVARLVHEEQASMIDHKNGNPLDNRRCNLRSASRAQNCQNARKCRKRTSSRFKGVSVMAGRWRAGIRVDNRRKHLGCFGSEEEAARAYDEAARELFGEFACVNFPRKGERGAL